MKQIKRVILTILVITTQSSVADLLTEVELHATLGVITHFILNDNNTTIMHHGIRYETVTSPYTSRVWLDRNLGATQVCTSFDDSECYGDYYQWGRNHDGHQESTSSITSMQAIDVNSSGSSFIISQNSPYDWTSDDSSGNLRISNWNKIDGSSICPTGFRVPTLVELRAELLDVDSAQIQNNIDAFNSFLKFPSAGGRAELDGHIGLKGLWGHVWVRSTNGSGSYIIGFSSSVVNAYGKFRAVGFSVRCLKD